MFHCSFIVTSRLPSSHAVAIIIELTYPRPPPPYKFTQEIHVLQLKFERYSHGVGLWFTSLSLLSPTPLYLILVLRCSMCMIRPFSLLFHFTNSCCESLVLFSFSRSIYGRLLVLPLLLPFVFYNFIFLNSSFFSLVLASFRAVYGFMVQCAVVVHGSYHPLATPFLNSWSFSIVAVLQIRFFSPLPLRLSIFIVSCSNVYRYIGTRLPGSSFLHTSLRDYRYLIESLWGFCDIPACVAFVFRPSTFVHHARIRTSCPSDGR